MKNILKLLFVVAILSSCGGEECTTDFSTCKFQEGDDVKIKNKFRHDNAVVTGVLCDCEYTITYYGAWGHKNDRQVKEYEIK